MKHRYFLGLAAVALLAITVTPVLVQGRVKDTVHNLNGNPAITVTNDEVCRPCHTPHFASTEVHYLWNHELTTATFTVFAGATSADVESSSSRLCLSCHDGTVALDSYGGGTGTQFVGADGFLGIDLTDDHPIGVDYPPAGTHGFNDVDPVTGHIVDPVETPVGSYASLEDGKVQCVSCHYAHGSRAPYGMFLKIDNTGSALCMTCHTR